MAKKDKQKLERWTPPAEEYSTAKKAGAENVSYSYDEPKSKNAKRQERAARANERIANMGDSASGLGIGTKKSPLQQAMEKYQGANASGGHGGRVTKDSAEAVKANKKPTLKEIASDPFLYASKAQENLLDNILNAGKSVFTPEKYKQEQAERAKANEALPEALRPKTGKALEGVVVKGADQAVSGLSSTLNWLAGNALKELGWENNPISKFNDAMQANREANEIYYGKNMANASKAAKTAETLGTSAVAVIPDMIVALLTSGTSLAAEGSGALAKGGAMLAGKEAAAQSTGAIRQAAESLFHDPTYWTAFSHTAGSSYDQAKEDGASEWAANMYALANGVLNAAIEAKSGFQVLPKQLRQGGKPLLKWIISAGEEGNEEVVQGVIERGLQNLIYSKDNPLFSVTDEDAVFNPVTAAKEYGSGAAIGLALGAPSALHAEAKSAPSTAEMIAEVVKATPPEQLERFAAQQAAKTNAENVQTTPETATENVTEAPAQPTRTAAQDIQDAADALGHTPTVDELMAHVMQSENPIEAYQRIDAAFKNGELVDTGNGGIYTRAEIEQRQTAMPESDHIDNRTAKDISSTKVKAFQYEHPELHEHFVKAAQAVMEDAAMSLSIPPKKVKKKYGGGTETTYSPLLARVLGATKLSRNKLLEVCEDIVKNHGAENYADAKRVEKVLDAMMAGKYDTPKAKYEDADYLEKKAKITGGTDPNSFKYALEHEYSLVVGLGEMTEEEAYDDWRQRREERLAEEAKTAQNATESPVSNPVAEQGADTAETQNAIVGESTGVQSETAEQPKNKLPEGHGAMSPEFEYREAQSQTRSSDTALNEEERQIEGLRPEDATHQVRTDADIVKHAAERIDHDYDGEKADLFDQSREWDAEDREVAYQILEAEVEKARETGDYSEVIKIKKEMNARGSTWGQVGHTMARHAQDAADIVADAATFLEENDVALPKDTTKEDFLKDIGNDAKELKNATRRRNGEQIIEIIKKLNAKRRTGGLFTAERTGKTLDNTLHAVLEQDGGIDFLANVAEAQLRARATDYAKMSPLEAIKAVRYQSMLSKITTVMRNLVGNNVFDPVESMSNNIGIIADVLMGLRTGRNTTAFDRSWNSPVKAKASWEAMQRAYIEAALDADTSGTENRFEQTSGRTFKMARNPFIRFLSTVEKYQAYLLNVTDEFQKGGIRAETQRGIDQLVEKGKLKEGELDGWADETARERTFQNQGRMATGLQGLRSSANTFASLQDSRGGSFGLGDAILPFARVPANIVGQFLNYSPAGLVKGTTQMLNVLKKGDGATAQEQAAAARAFGRGVNGSAILAAFAWMAAKGVLNVAGGGDDQEEKDLAKMQQTEGITGTQLNIDAALRGLTGKSTAWKNGDDIMNIGFLEPINGLMALGSLLWDSAEDEGLTAGDIGSATAEAALQAISDLPAVSSLTNIFNNYKYSSAESVGGKVAETGVKFLGDTATSFIPNALSGIAQGIDEGKIRQTYGSNKGGVAGVAEDTLHAAMAKLPGLRQQLPSTLDAFGQEKKTTASAWQNWLNSNILPGSITKYKTDQVKSELESLWESGADVKIPDRAAPKKVDTENGKLTLTNTMQRNYQRTYGNQVSMSLNQLFNSAEYKSMSTEEKAAAVNSIEQYATAVAKRSVGGKAEIPSWATKGGNSVAENAVYRAMLETVKDGASGEKDSDLVKSLSKQNYDYDTTVQLMSQFMSDSSVKNYTNAYSHGYGFDVSAAFQGAWKETSYEWGTTDAGNPKQRGKDRTIQWAQDNLGLTYNQALELYKYLNP